MYPPSKTKSRIFHPCSICILVHLICSDSIIKWMKEAWAWADEALVGADGAAALARFFCRHWTNLLPCYHLHFHHPEVLTIPCADALVESMRGMLTLTCHDFLVCTGIKQTKHRRSKLQVLVCVYTVLGPLDLVSVSLKCRRSPNIIPTNYVLTTTSMLQHQASSLVLMLLVAEVVVAVVAAALTAPRGLRPPPHYQQHCPRHSARESSPKPFLRMRDSTRLTGSAWSFVGMVAHCRHKKYV